MSQAHPARSDRSSGHVLAAARQELDLSVIDVARHLKLSPAQVEALEEGAYERLPGRVFVRGFLRNYAKLVGVDPQPLLRSIESQIEPAAAEVRAPSPQVVMPREQAARWPLYTVVAAALVVGALAVYEFGFNEPPQAAPPEGDVPAATQGAGDAAAASPAAEPPMMALPLAAAPGATLAAAPAPAAGAQSNLPQGEAVGAVGQAPKSARAGGQELYFKFDQESWVEVRDRNDRVIFSRLNQAGSEERVNAAPPVKIVVGNARGVRLTYNERSVDLSPHTGVSVARLTLE